MFNMESQPTITESVVESTNSGIESADSTTDSAANPLKIGLWVLAFEGCHLSLSMAFEIMHRMVETPVCV